MQYYTSAYHYWAAKFAAIPAKKGGERNDTHFKAVVRRNEAAIAGRPEGRKEHQGLQVRP